MASPDMFYKVGIGFNGAKPSCHLNSNVTIKMQMMQLYIYVQLYVYLHILLHMGNFLKIQFNV